MERLQKLIANAGYGSRRGVEKLIEQGRVVLNNKTAQLGDKASVVDRVQIDGKKIDLSRYQQDKTQILILNKPSGVVCSKADDKGRKSIFDALPSNTRWVMVGRLDINTSGLLLFTNNGELAHRLMHPSSQIDREYSVRVLGKLDDAAMKKLTQGVELEDGMAKFLKIRPGGGEGANRWYKVVLREGRKREVRRLFEALGLKVSRLIRIRFGDIRLKSELKSNQFEYLKPTQVSAVLKSVGLSE